MTDTTASEQQKQRVRTTFDKLAATYDSLRFTQIAARRLLELTPIPIGARVLDVATGTGLVALAAAEIVGPNGMVIGIDMSDEMLARAREKVNAVGPNHVEFRAGDAERLDFPDESFDVVLCASSLFFMPDMLAVAREWRRVLAAGGSVGFTSFGTTLFQPVGELWGKRLQQYGIEGSAPPQSRLADPAACERLLREAGFTQIEAYSEALGYYLPSAEARWEEIEASLDRITLSKLTPEQREQIKAEHIEELDALATDKGIWVSVPVIFAFGKKQ